MTDTEIELKLALNASGAAALRREPLVRGTRTDAPTEKRLFAVYYDTADHALAAARIALRLRDEGGRLVQTVKCPNGSKSGVQTRREVEAEAADHAVSLDRISDPEVAERVRAAIGEAPLVPVFTTDIQRTIWPIAYRDSRIELVLDSGVISLGGPEAAGTGPSLPVSEAELELEAGSPRDLLAFADALRRRVAFRVATESKAARGYRLHDGSRPTPQKARQPTLSEDMTAREALAAILDEGVAQLLANEPVVFAGDDPEGVHQARVAVRRMRAALSAFKPVIGGAERKRLSRRLRWLQRALGPARDWDVFLAETLAPVRADRPADAGMAEIIDRARARRDAGYAAARQALYRKRYTRLVLALEAWRFTDNPKAERVSTGAFARDLLDRRYAAVRKAAGGDPEALSVGEQHQLRIELKKLRYATEFFGALFPEDARRPFLKRCKKLQDTLGALNDAAVAQRLMRDIADGADDPAKALDADAVAAIEARHAHRVAKEMRRLAKRWEAFSDAAPFWRSGTEAAAKTGAAKKTAAKKESAKKTAAKKTAAKKASAKKTAAKKAPAKGGRVSRGRAAARNG